MLKYTFYRSHSIAVIRYTTSKIHSLILIYMKSYSLFYESKRKDVTITKAKVDKK